MCIKFPTYYIQRLNHRKMEAEEEHEPISLQSVYEQRNRIGNNDIALFKKAHEGERGKKTKIVTPTRSQGHQKKKPPKTKQKNPC